MEVAGGGIIFLTTLNLPSGHLSTSFNMLYISPATSIVYIWAGVHLAWPLVVGALLVIAKRGAPAQPQTPAKLSGANCAGPMGNP
jgi:hypothetical protein